MFFFFKLEVIHVALGFMCFTMFGAFQEVTQFFLSLCSPPRERSPEQQSGGPNTRRSARHTTQEHVFQSGFTSSVRSESLMFPHMEAQSSFLSHQNFTRCSQNWLHRRSEHLAPHRSQFYFSHSLVLLCVCVRVEEMV